MKIKSILASAVSTSIVVAALAISPSSANVVDDLVSANYQNLQWGLKAVRAQAAWGAGYTGNGVKVAVIDTGVDASHADLSGQIVNGATISYDPANLIDNGVTITDTAANDFTDEYGHGTHVSGIIAALHNNFGVTGLAYGAKIMPIKLSNLDAMDLPAFSQSLVDGLNYAVDHGAKVVNLSLGGPALEESAFVDLTPDDIAYKVYTTAICNAVTAANDAGVVVVAAAGNYYQQGNPSLVPATCSGAISVASEAPNSTSTSYFSTTDPGVDITAPGESIISTIPTNYESTYYQDFPYMEMSGTSMASPYVAAAAALYIEKAGNPTPAETKTHLEQSATDMTAIAGWDPYTGAGLVDAAALVGADAVQTSLSGQPYLRLTGGRPANNFSDSLTFLWDAPQESTLPTSYDLEIIEKTSGTVTTFNFDGNQVRGTIPWLTINDYSYIQLIAHYAGHDETSFPQLYSVPQDEPTNLPTPTALNYTLDSDGELHVTWNDVPSTNVGYLELTVSGTSVDWVQQDFYKNGTGHFATSFSTYLTGVDVLNSDFTVSLQAWSGQMSAGIPANAYNFAKSPSAITSYEFLSNKVLRVWAASNRIACDSNRSDNCLAKPFSYDYQIATLTPPNRLNISKSRTPLNGYSDEYGQIFFDNLVTNVSGRSSLQSIQLTAKGRYVPRLGVYPVYIYYALPMGATPESIRVQAGFPAKKN